ncbi:hypothetical protein [Streptomyces sp. NPDC059466]|uniref:hypothetical protein n=1 Tax=unclassified Streptomyces TaxID=2593676 RepID=UPI0036CDE7DC
MDRAPAKVARRGGEAVLIDGTFILTSRRTGKGNRKNCSEKHKRHGQRFLGRSPTNADADLGPRREARAHPRHHRCPPRPHR